MNTLWAQEFGSGGGEAREKNQHRHTANSEKKEDFFLHSTYAVVALSQMQRGLSPTPRGIAGGPRCGS